MSLSNLCILTGKKVVGFPLSTGSQGTCFQSCTPPHGACSIFHLSGNECLLGSFCPSEADHLYGRPWVVTCQLSPCTSVFSGQWCHPPDSTANFPTNIIAITRGVACQPPFTLTCHPPIHLMPHWLLYTLCQCLLLLQNGKNPWTQITNEKLSATKNHNHNSVD